VSVSICLLIQNDDHDEWDYASHEYDSDFADLLVDWQEVEYKDKDKLIWRPLDIEDFRDRIENTNWDADSKERYHVLLDLIEDEPDCWIYIDE
jgi:hypothetical protein